MTVFYFFFSGLKYGIMAARVFFAFENMRPPEFGGEYDTALTHYFQLARRTGIRDGYLPRQVHGAAILAARPPDRGQRPLLPHILGEGDAVWIDRPGAWVGVLTADCLPLLLETESRVMAVHAGWRGIAAGILARAVEFLGGGARIRSATLGPAAAGCCYEVGGEVPDAFRAAGIEPVRRGRNLDLPLTAEAELRRLGVTGLRRSDPFGCTICDSRFHSFRRTPRHTGRNLAAIAL